MQVEASGDAEVARIAGAQKGDVVRLQLQAAGIGRGAIAHRLATARLTAVHPGVYYAGSPPFAALAEEMAAVLHYRGYAVLSHRSAAWLWGLVDSRPSETTLTIVRGCHPRPGIKLHRVRALDAQEVRIRSGLPVTSPARTLLDFAADAETGELEHAIATARFRDFASNRELERVLARNPARKGCGRLRRLIEADELESDGERRMFALLKAAELPLPQTQVPMFGFRADFLWPAQKLVVEVDGYDFHGDRAKFESDCRRDQVLIAAGYRVIRITWRQLHYQPYAVIARLAQALAQAA
jgi:very-short-patch-repair endonuclease